MSNKLANENSPYLLQHADNPVEWYPWGEEALARAQAEDKPILLSIGYAACHWCHVMAHESFEDGETAVLMNRDFINIKVDREERPDIDTIYMNAVVALTGQGGWPLTAVLTPDGRPWFGGTYFPKEPRYGMISFKQLLGRLAGAWQEQRDQIEKSADSISGHLGRQIGLAGADAGGLDPNLIPMAINTLHTNFDVADGGFGQAPKFPPSMTLEFLLRVHLQHGNKMALEMAEQTLKKMAYGGMYDQLGGGFARYSTDKKWLVPHFEKMLYDNAQLARVYLHAWQLTDNALYRRIAEETLDFVVRELRHEDGGFYSSYDADSEGEEGLFYIWQADEIRDVLGDEAEIFIQSYGVTEQGNWEGANILHVPRNLAEVASEAGLSVTALATTLESARKKLYDVRAQREWPGLDDKVLTAWNGLMLAAFAEAGRLLKRPDYTEVAVQNADFLWRTMRDENGRLLRTWKAGGQAKYAGYLEDYAFLAEGLLALYQNVFDERWFSWAQTLMTQVQTHFVDDEHGGFFDTADDAEALILRPKTIQDNAVPSGNAVAATVLLKLSLYTGESALWQTAEKMTAALLPAMQQYPTGFGQWLTAATFIMGQPQELAIVGEAGEAGTEALLDVVQRQFRPFLITAVGDESSAIPLLNERTQLDGQPTAYVCRSFVCQLPVNTPEALAKQL